MSKQDTSYEPYPSFERSLPPELVGKIFFDDEDSPWVRRHYQETNWQEAGFDLQQTIYRLLSPTVEIGGPTRGGFRILKNIKLPKPLFVSNIQLRQPRFYPEEIDFFADGCHMPNPDNSVGLILASGITGISEVYAQGNHPDERVVSRAASQEYADYIASEPLKSHFNQRIAIIEECARILIPDGLMVFTLFPEDIEVAKINELKLRQTHSLIATYPEIGPKTWVTGVLQKSSASAE